MKRSGILLVIIIVQSSLFAKNPQFSLIAQIEWILFHGFTTIRYNSSDDLLAAQSQLENHARVKGLLFSSDKAQPIGYYAFYSTNSEQSSISFIISPLSTNVINETYFVPYTLNYTLATGNKKTTYGDGVIEGKNVASTIDPGSTTEIVLKTKEESTGLRYEIISLSVEFEGTKNVSFGLPEVNGQNNNYTGTISTIILAN